MSKQKLTISKPWFGFANPAFLRLYYLLCYRPKFSEFTSFDKFLANYRTMSEEKCLQELSNMITLRLEYIRRVQETTLNL